MGDCLFNIYNIATQGPPEPQDARAAENSPSPINVDDWQLAKDEWRAISHELYAIRGY